MKTNKIPEKLVYRIDEVGRIAQLDAKVIESWEQEFPFLNAGRTAQGDKIFRQKDLRIVLRLKELLVQNGMTLAGAKRKIEEEFGLKTGEPVHPDRLKKTLIEVRDELQYISDSLANKSKKL